MDLAWGFFPFEIIKRITCFSRFELCFETYAGCTFSFLGYKTFRAIVTLFFSNFFQSSFSDGKFVPFQFYLFIKDLIFLILYGYFFISSWLNATITAYWKHSLPFLLIEFIVVFFVFYPIRRTYVWSTTTWIYFMTFIIQ